MLHDPTTLPADLPIPVDDGRAAHLEGSILPDVALAATDGTEVRLARLTGRSVIYAYPRTGQPGQALPDGWDAIPGARGCTPQSCAFRDHSAELRDLEVAHLFGLSTQDSTYQREAAERLHLPFPLLSDEGLAFTKAAGLPTFETSGMVLLKRLTMIVDDGRATKVFYPVFPPDRSADEVLGWLRATRS
jgi:peroxiredoxin